MNADVLDAVRDLAHLGNERPSATHIAIRLGFGRNGAVTIAAALEALCRAGQLRKRPSGRYEIPGNPTLEAV